MRNLPYLPEANLSPVVTWQPKRSIGERIWRVILWCVS